MPQQRSGPAAANPNGGPPVPASADGRGTVANAPVAGWQPLDVSPVKGQVEVTVDAAGQVFLRGVVASEEAGREIADAARSVPGVSHVETQFQVLPRRAGGDTAGPPRSRHSKRSSPPSTVQPTRICPPINESAPYFTALVMSS